MAEPSETPWAPSQCKGMRCACVSHDAETCMSMRTGRYRLYGLDPDDDLSIEDFERCECSCHGRDIDEGWDSSDNEYCTG